MHVRSPETEGSLKQLAEARDRFLAGEETPAGVRLVVLESWKRSASYGVHPRQMRRQPRDPDRLADARQASRTLIRSATPFMEIMHDTLADEPHLVVLSDRDGLILLTYGSDGLPPSSLEEANLVEGASWHERAIGCNGIGTCLAVEEPVLLVGPEHFQEAYVGWTCIGVPVRGPDGAIAGAIDLSVPNDRAQTHAWGWTISVARGIETALAHPGPGGRAEAEREIDAPEAPAHSVRGVLEGIVSGLQLPEPHPGFVDKAIAELDEMQAVDLVRVNELLQRDRELLERLIDEIPVMVTIYDPEIQEVRLNKHFEEVAGWTNEDLDHIDIMEACYPDPKYREEVRRYMASLETGWRDFELVARDGSTVHTSWANIRLNDRRQVGIGVDITGRKEAEEQVRQALEDTRAALRERDEILAVVSHDLRNPVSTMVMASSLLLDDEIDDDHKDSQVVAIRRSADQMKRLIDDLLDVSRIESGGLTIVRRPCSSIDLVAAAVQAQAPFARAESVTLEAGEVEPATVEADPDRILQVFGNLVSNAIEHSPEGGTVTIHAARADDEVVFSVRDRGSGIAAEHLPHVFDRFWQARKTRQGGAGLGLAIARGIIESHDGRIWAESEPGQGSTFSFTLPLGGEDDRPAA